MKQTTTTIIPINRLARSIKVGYSARSGCCFCPYSELRMDGVRTFLCFIIPCGGVVSLFVLLPIRNTLPITVHSISFFCVMSLRCHLRSAECVFWNHVLSLFLTRATQSKRNLSLINYLFKVILFDWAQWVNGHIGPFLLYWITWNSWVMAWCFFETKFGSIDFCAESLIIHLYYTRVIFKVVRFCLCFFVILFVTLFRSFEIHTHRIHNSSINIYYWPLKLTWLPAMEFVGYIKQ